jgi:hypothetical protein
LLDTRDVTRVLASCDGITVTVLLYGWAVMHYFFGAIGLEREMREAARHNAVIAAANAGVRS